MRKLFTTAFVLVAMVVFATSALALEKTAARLTDDSRGDDWNANTTVTVFYYNYCTGWIWILSGFSIGDQFGVCFDGCDAGILTGMWMLNWDSGAPSGYGFTGTLKVYCVDDQCCKISLLADQPWLPGTMWNFYAWNVCVPPKFAIMAQVAAPPGINTIADMVCDHPAPVGADPAACGYCYPVDRVVHTFFWGTKTTKLCPPGLFWNDGTCDVELVWDIDMKCPVSVEEQSWGQIKNLYK
jgi:hypothetical protein